MKFQISKTDQIAIQAWAEKQEKKTKGEYGAIGGGYTYKFTPTGLGTIFIVQNTVTKEELNLTDYEHW